MAIENDKYVNKNNDVAGFDNLTKFDVFLQNNRYLDPFLTGFAFTFVTKPSLFIYPYKPVATAGTIEKLAYENMTKDHIFSQFLASESMNINDKFLAEQLSFYNGIFPSEYVRSNFLPIFTNRSKNFSTLDVTLGQVESFDTRQGFRMPMPTHKNESIGAGSLSITCMETSNLDFMKMMTLWVNYITNVTDGTFNANPEMIRNGVIDYASSIYYFVVEPDGRTLKYWAKYTGCWPTTIPQSNLSFSRGSQEAIDTEIQFVYSSKEDMNPSILEDFNRVSLNYFEETMLNIEQDEYPSIRNSPLLSKSAIRANVNYIKELRGPMVFYKASSFENSGNNTPLSDKFELTFGEDVFKNTFAETKFEGQEYLFKNEDFFSSNLDK